MVYAYFSFFHHQILCQSEILRHSLLNAFSSATKLCRAVTSVWRHPLHCTQSFAPKLCLFWAIPVCGSGIQEQHGCVYSAWCLECFEQLYVAMHWILLLTFTFFIQVGWIINVLMLLFWVFAIVFTHLPHVKIYFDNSLRWMLYQEDSIIERNFLFFTFNF